MDITRRLDNLSMRMLTHQRAKERRASTRRIAALSEAKFWKDIEPLGWGTKSTDYKAMKKILLNTWDEEEAESVSDLIRKLRGQLGKAVTEWQDDNDQDLGLYGDSYEDLMNHIIGMGKKEFDACIKDPSRIADRADKSAYTESFAYALPHYTDYQKREQGLKHFHQWAGEVMGEYGGAARNDLLKPIQKDCELIAAAMKDLIEGNEDAFLKKEKAAKDAAERAEDYSRKLREAAGDISNKWAVWNLFSDVREALDK